MGLTIKDLIERETNIEVLRKFTLKLFEDQADLEEEVVTIFPSDSEMWGETENAIKYFNKIKKEVESE